MSKQPVANLDCSNHAVLPGISRYSMGFVSGWAFSLQAKRIFQIDQMTITILNVFVSLEQDVFTSGR